MAATPPEPASSHEHENDNLKPGAPPRPSTEPDGGEQAPVNPHTQTDPATGAPNKGR